MKILGLDSSGLVAGAAIVEDDILLGEYTINHKKTHSQTLLPMLDALREMLELDMDSLDAIAIAAGPGSFTGLRIGAATAKGLGLALNKPLVEVPTLEGLAYNLYGSNQLICPLMDARRNQVYTGIYEFVRQDGEYRLQEVLAQCAMDVDALIERLNALGMDAMDGDAGGREVILLGDGVPVYGEALRSKLTIPFSFAAANNNRQRAASIAALGGTYYKEGRTVSAAEHKPEYLRKSQAEREQEEKANGTH